VSCYRYGRRWHRDKAEAILATKRDAKNALIRIFRGIRKCQCLCSVLIRSVAAHLRVAGRAHGDAVHAVLPVSKWTNVGIGAIGNSSTGNVTRRGELKGGAELVHAGSACILVAAVHDAATRCDRLERQHAHVGNLEIGKDRERCFRQLHQKRQRALGDLQTLFGSCHAGSAVLSSDALLTVFAAGFGHFSTHTDQERSTSSIDPDSPVMALVGGKGYG
jgi:hypothetical protein